MASKSIFKDSDISFGVKKETHNLMGVPYLHAADPWTARLTVSKAVLRRVTALLARLHASHLCPGVSIWRVPRVALEHLKLETTVLISS